MVITCGSAGGSGERAAARSLGLALVLGGLLLLPGCFHSLAVIERGAGLAVLARPDPPAVAVAAVAEQLRLTRDVAGEEFFGVFRWVIDVLIPIPFCRDYRLVRAPRAVTAKTELEGSAAPAFARALAAALTARGLEAEVLSLEGGSHPVAELLAEARRVGAGCLLVVWFREYRKVTFLGERGEIREWRGSLVAPSSALFRASDGGRLYACAREHEYFAWTPLPWLFWWDGPRPHGGGHREYFPEYRHWVERRLGRGREEAFARSAREIAGAILDPLAPPPAGGAPAGER